VFDEGPALAGDGVFRSLHLINGMIRQLDNTHSHTLRLGLRTARLVLMGIAYRTARSDVVVWFVGIT